MSRRFAAFAVVALVLTAAAYLAFPRYQLTVIQSGVVRFDRWTGQVEAAGWGSTVSWLTRPLGAGPAPPTAPLGIVGYEADPPHRTITRDDIISIEPPASDPAKR